MSIPQKSQSCGNCRFFANPPLERRNEEQPQCRKNTPQVFLIPVMTSRLAGTQETGMQVMAFWPPMSADKWCGSWDRIED